LTHGSETELDANTIKIVSDYLDEARWAGKAGIRRCLNRSGITSSISDVVRYLDSSDAYVSESGLYCHVDQRDAMLRHVKSVKHRKQTDARKAKGRKSATPRRPTLKRTYAYPSKPIKSGVCAYCGKPAEFVNNHTTWGSVKLCDAHHEMMISRPVQLPASHGVHIIYSGMGTGRRS